MSYTISHRKRDGSVETRRVTVERKGVRIEDPRMTSGMAERIIADQLKDKKKRLRDRHGWSKGRESKLIASIPSAVVEEVIKNDGAEAAGDYKYLIRRSLELGFDPRMRK